VSRRCEPEYGAMGIVGFIYQSVKDSIKDVRLNIKDLRMPVMAIGRVVYMKDEDFNKFASSTSKSINEMSVDEINKIAGV
jgi:hypothetical protein